MSAPAVLAQARAAGVELLICDGKLASRGPATPELRAMIREHKPELMALLATPATADRPRHSALADVVAYFGNPSRGPCVLCGGPVTRLGKTHGFRNAFGDLRHVRCPT